MKKQNSDTESMSDSRSGLKIEKSITAFVVSDIHFPYHSKVHWEVFKQIHADIKPDITLVLGDFLDLLPMSSHPKRPEDPTEIASSIKMFVREMEILRKDSGSIAIIEGNHERRYERYLRGAMPHVLNGLSGLTLEDQCRSFGLHKSINWHKETPQNLGLRIGNVLARHGDQQASKFGGSTNVASWLLSKSYGQSVVSGHFHKSGVYYRTTSTGVNFFGVGNGCLADNTYAPGHEWSLGFTALEVMAPDFNFVNPYCIVMESDGRCSFRGKTYGVR